MITHKKIGGLHFVAVGPYGFSFHRRRGARPILSPAMVGVAVAAAVSLALIAAAPRALEYAEREGKAARWMLTQDDNGMLYVRDFNLTFEDCAKARDLGQRCRLQPKGMFQ